MQDFGLDVDYEVDKYLFGHWESTENENKYELIEGKLSKYNYKVISKWYGIIGELYVYDLEEKKLSLIELNDFINKENNTPEFVKNWLTKLMLLIEKSIELEESTLIIGFEV